MKEKRKVTKGTVIFLIAFLVIMVILNCTGVVSIGSGIRIGWFENKGTNEWSANYISFTGFRERELNTADTADVLHVSIETEGGTIALEVKDTNGNSVYSEKEIPTSSFDIEIPGAVTAIVTAKNHKGNFDIRW